MADDHLFSIARFMDAVLWTPSWVSNGHFAAKKERVKLGLHLTSNDAVICAYPKAKTITEWDDGKVEATFSEFAGIRVEFARSPWCHRNAALFLDATGHAAWLNADYCDALRLETVYGPAAMFAPEQGGKTAPYLNAPIFDDATVVIMPMTVPVDWDQVARTVAAATSMEDATATRFDGMPEPEPESPPEVPAESDDDGPQLPLGAVAGTLMRELGDPNSETSKAIRPKTGSVTITAGGVSKAIKALEGRSK